MNLNKKNINIQYLVLGAGIIILLAKIYAWQLTRSNAILTDALESVVNVIAASFALFSLMLSARPKDKNHPYGHGKIEFLSAGLEGTLIIIAGVAMITKSFYNFFFPIELQRLDVGIGITVAAGMFNFLLGKMAVNQGSSSHSLTLLAAGKHLITDAWSTAGMVLGLGVIFFTGWIWLDNALAILFGGIIAYTGWGIVRKSVAGIMDEADYEVMESLVQILNEQRKPQWIDIHNLRVIKYGPRLHIDCHITLPWYYNLQQANREVEEIDRLVNQHSQRKVEFFIHSDPCIPSSCKLCEISDCKVRQEDFQTRSSWTLDTLMSNTKHGSPTISP